jgi:nicotinamidase-related amidase
VLTVEDTLLLIIDVQEKLFPVMYDKEALRSNLVKMVRGCVILDVPVMVSEQNPTGLGSTISELVTLLPNSAKVTKFNFSCCRELGFEEKLKETGRGNILVCGIESHICVYQTAMDLVSAGYVVHVVSDCVSSRSFQNKEVALRRLAAENVKLTSAEMALFELLRTAKAPHFKTISALVKE